MVPEGSAFLQAAFCVLPAVVAAGFLFLLSQARREWAIPGLFGILVWMGITGALGSSGVLNDFARMPPPFMFLVTTMLVLTLALGFSPIGTLMAQRLPFWMLVGSQAFRFPLELAMHRAADEGVMPRQMSYDGLNFDIVTGISALLLGLALYRGQVPTILVKAWNAVGFVLLVNIVTIAILSAPVPFRIFLEGPPNVWVTRAPFVWLPTVMVAFALFGHVLVFRKFWLVAHLDRGLPVN